MKLQVNIILDLMDLIGHAESIYRVHNSFDREKLRVNIKNPNDNRWGFFFTATSVIWFPRNICKNTAGSLCL